MEESKFALQRGYKKAAHKTSLLQIEKKSTKSKSVKKLPNKFKKKFEELDDMGSLVFLKDGTERKKLNGIDERIELLKTELKSLLGNKKFDKDCSTFTDNKNDLVNDDTDLINVDEINQVAPKVLDSYHEKSWEFCKEPLVSDVNKFKPNTSSIPSKFSEWLDKTIDEIKSKPEATEGNLFNMNNTPLNSELQLNSKNFFTKIFPSLTSDFKSKFFNISLLPEDQVEKLLYKSLVMQNSEIYLSSSEDSAQECITSIVKTNHKKYRRSRKCRKHHKERLVQSNLNKNSGISQKGRKRRLTNRNLFLNEVEIIDLDNNLSNNSGSNKELPETDCEVLDIDNYDWNEPFDLDEDTRILSDVELMDNFKKNNVKLNNQDLKFSDTEMLEHDQSVCYSGYSENQKKAVWECPVCFEQSKGQEIVATQCGHIFCRSCIENHSSKLGKSCPSCRSDLKDKPLITLFNF